MNTAYLYHDQHKVFVPLHDGLTIGRTSGDLKFSDDQLVSSVHCRFHVVGSSIYVEDLDSTNRTQVNRVPILPNRKRRIWLDDVIKVGDQRLILTQQKQHHPSGCQDRTLCQKLVVEPVVKEERDLLAVAVATSQEDEPKTMLLANAELSVELDSLKRRKQKILVLTSQESVVPLGKNPGLAVRAAAGVLAMGALLLAFF